MNMNKTMPAKSGDVMDSDELDHYGQVLKDFGSLRREPDEPRPRQRRSIMDFARSLKSTGGSASLPFVSPISPEKSPNSVQQGKRRKSDGTARTTSASSSRSSSLKDCDLTDFVIGPKSSVSMSLAAGTKKEMLEGAKRCPSPLIGSGTERREMHTRWDTAEEEIDKLDRKIRILKSKRKDEKIKLMQKDEILKAQRIEIEGLQQELDRSLDDVEQLQKQRSSDKAVISRLTKQLEDVKFVHSPSDSLLHETSTQLQIAQSKLQFKDATISKLEQDLEQARRLVQNCQGQNMPEAIYNETSSGVIDLLDCQAECGGRQTKNRLLELVGQELNDKRQEQEVEDGDLSYSIDLSLLEVPSEMADSFEKEIESFTLEGSQPSVCN